MAINFNTLFARLGKVFKFAYLMNTYQATINGNINGIMSEFSTLPDSQAVAALPTLALSNRQATGGIFNVSGGLQASAVAILQQTVTDDNPAQASTLTTSLNEVIRQMASQSATVQVCTVAASAAVISGYTNQGNGAIVVSTKRGDGLTNENIVAEVGNLVVQTDSQTGGASAGNETWQYTGQPTTDANLLDTWPSGSGSGVSISGISSAGNNGSLGNLLNNSDFETWAGGPLALSNWVLTTGTWALDIVRESATIYTGTYAAKLVGNAGGTAVKVDLRQQFNASTTGTAGTVKPDTAYAVNFAIKADVIPAAGVLRCSLIDQNGTIITDDQSVQNVFTLSLTGSPLTTSYKHIANMTLTSGSNVFRLPKLLPAQVWLRIDITTAISTGSNIFIDDCALGALTALYNGGPSVAIFSGSTVWVAGDRYALTMTNDRGGQLYCGTMQAEFDKFFDMRTKGLLLPSAANVFDVQTVSCSYTPTGGTFTLTYTAPNGIAATTAGIAYNASAAVVQAALRLLSNIGGANVVCSNGALPGTPVVCTFAANLPGLQTAMTVNYSGLTGGTPGTMSVAHTTPGTPTISDGSILD